MKQLLSIICYSSSTESSQAAWIPSPLKESMGMYSEIKVEDPKNLLYILLQISKQFQTKLELFRTSSRQGMHVTAFLKYSVNDSESRQTRRTTTGSSLNCLTYLQSLLAKCLQHILIKSNTIEGVLLFCAWSTRRRSAKTTFPGAQNPHFSTSQCSSDLCIKDLEENGVQLCRWNKDVKQRD